MTPDEIIEIKERLSQTTPGPWTQDGWLILSAECIICTTNVNCRSIVGDANFIAHAREDIERLVKEIARLRDALAEAEASSFIGLDDRAYYQVTEMKDAIRKALDG